MGGKLQAMVTTHWGDVQGNAYKVLMVMAMSALDTAEVPTYWGGAQRLAVCGLGRRDWPADHDQSAEAKLYRRASLEAVKRAVAVLKAAGAITSDGMGRHGQNAVYGLHLERRWGTETVPTRGTETVPNGVGKPCAKGHGKRAPEDKLRFKDIPGEDSNSSRSVDSPAPVASLDKARARLDAERKGTPQ